MRAAPEEGSRRTCVGCRQVMPKAGMIRLIRRSDGRVVVDPAGRGRGAYVCPDEGCVARALKAGQLAHAFRKPCEAGAGLAEEVTRAWQRRRSR